MSCAGPHRHRPPCRPHTALRRRLTGRPLTVPRLPAPRLLLQVNSYLSVTAKKEREKDWCLLKGLQPCSASPALPVCGLQNTCASMGKILGILASMPCACARACVCVCLPVQVGAALVPLWVRSPHPRIPTVRVLMHVCASACTCRGEQQW